MGEVPKTVDRKAPMSETRKAFLLRMNTGLWRELEAWAREEFRSVNGQIEFLLREAVRCRRGLPAEAIEKPVDTGIPPKPELPASAPNTDSELEMGRHD